MQTNRFVSVVAATSALACAACAGGPTETSAAAGRWGSDQASLTNQGNAATLQVAAGQCYGSYGQTDQAIPNGSFSVPGTYTQLEGAYPGKVQYAAQFTGTVQGTQMQITVNVPALNRDVGPFVLTRGVNSGLPRCLYP
jgi:hypothetical protein